VEIGNLENQTPDSVRIATMSICEPFGPAGNFGLPFCPQVAINAVNGPAKWSLDDTSDALSYVAPLAFTQGAVPTLYGDPNTNGFFYAHVLEGANGPQALELLVEQLPGTSKPSFGGLVPVTLKFPAVILNSNGTETPVSATLHAACLGLGPCPATVSGFGPGNKTYSAHALGLNFSFVLSPSPQSLVPHPIAALSIPLVVTKQNDPAYFFTTTTSPCPSGVNPASGYCEAFLQQALGFPASVLGNGASVGIAPYPAPLCTSTTCPTTPPVPPAPPPPTYFGFCASFSKNTVIAAYAGIGTDATTYATSPVPGTGVTLPVCPQS
jgi:hypothetical protein